MLSIFEGGGRGAGIVALQADIGVLPIEEQNESELSSQRPGCMHACGYDTHIAMLLGAARLLAERRDHWGGEVRLMFQPAEEIEKGTKDFLAAGCLEGVSRVFGIHVAPDLPLGTVAVQPGLTNAAVDMILDGCKDLAETKEKVQRLIKNQGGEKFVLPSV